MHLRAPLHGRNSKEQGELVEVEPWNWIFLVKSYFLSSLGAKEFISLGDYLKISSLNQLQKVAFFVQITALDCSSQLEENGYRQSN